MTTKSDGNYSLAGDAREMIACAREENIATVWDRLRAQEPQCGYCSLGVSCRNCAMGPCRIDPFGEGPRQGVCGADADIIVARNLGRTIAAGASAHSDHGRDILETFQALADGRPNAAALNGIHCAISAADSLCVRFHGKRSSSKDHGDAVRLLAELFADEETRRQANRLGIILGKKNQVQYEERMFSPAEAAKLAKQVERLFAWVASRMGKA